MKILCKIWHKDRHTRTYTCHISVLKSWLRSICTNTEQMFMQTMLLSGNNYVSTKLTIWQPPFIPFSTRSSYLLHKEIHPTAKWYYGFLYFLPCYVRPLLNLISTSEHLRNMFTSEICSTRDWFQTFAMFVQADGTPGHHVMKRLSRQTC